MSESPNTQSDESQKPVESPVEEVRTEEPQAPFGADEPNPAVVSDETSEEAGLSGEDALPPASGYAGRDPKTEMPRFPHVSEEGNQEAKTHDGAPKEKRKRPWASE